jgi:hypothetical protein
MGHIQTIYTTQLQAGLGRIEETKLLLAMYEPGMSVNEIHEHALNSGLFPMVSSRSLRNIIAECFFPRYVKPNAAVYLKTLAPNLPSHVLNQFLLIFTARANKILLDFIREVYWPVYSSGQDTLSTADAKLFIANAVADGKTRKVWSDTTIRRMSSYLLGCCADYGLLASGRSSTRRIQPLRIHDHTLLFFTYWLHAAGIGDNSIIGHDIWKIFGLEPSDVREELKRIANYGWIIVQSAGNITRLSWSFTCLEEVIDVITQR